MKFVIVMIFAEYTETGYFNEYWFAHNVNVTALDKYIKD
jgi:hypothetical protein